jgi:hypothetical protein
MYEQPEEKDPSAHPFYRAIVFVRYSPLGSCSPLNLKQHRDSSGAGTGALLAIHGVLHHRLYSDDGVVNPRRGHLTLGVFASRPRARETHQRQERRRIADHSELLREVS